MRQLEDKYARNVHKMPPYNPSFDQKEHDALVEKGTKAWAGHSEEKGPTETDLKELLEFSESMSKWARNLSDKELVYRFQHWKRSHGFVDEKSEKEMRELWHLLHD